jgi:hypothetical protein
MLSTYQYNRHGNSLKRNEQSPCVVIKGAINKSLDIHLNRPWRAASSSSKRGLGSQCLVGCRAGRGKRKVQDSSHILGINIAKVCQIGPPRITLNTWSASHGFTHTLHIDHHLRGGFLIKYHRPQKMG